MPKDAKDKEASALAGGILMPNVRWLTAPRWLSVCQVYWLVALFHGHHKATAVLQRAKPVLFADKSLLSYSVLVTSIFLAQ